MRRALLFMGLVLLTLGTLAPTLEALAPCSQECVDEGPARDCADDQCCSCCIHLRLVRTDRTTPGEPLSRSSRMQAPGPAFPSPADPLDILHIPKTPFA